MYLLYNIIQLQKLSLEHTLLTKYQNWRFTKSDIESLTIEQLQDAARAVANEQMINNPTIKRLLRDLTAIGTSVPQSFSQKLKLQSQIRGLLVWDGMADIWITINLSDLRNSLVLHLAGVEYPQDAHSTANAAIHNVTATSNPVAITQFFHHTCKGFFDGLLRSNTGQIGILGQVSNHFGVVETNDHGMLHLYTLV